MPTLATEIGFSAGASTSDYFHLDDASRGVLDTGTLAPEGILTDVSEFVRHGSLTRGSSRAQGPLVTYEAGTATLGLRNEDRRFDPTNLDGPYVSGGLTEVEPMRVVTLRATWNGETYSLWRGYADSWAFTYNKAATYSECVLTGTDGFKVLAAVSRPEVAPEGAGEDAGARVNRILDSAGWETTDRMVSTGDTTLQATTLEGSPLDELQLVAETELGEFYIDGAGRAVFRNRLAVLEDERSNTPQATFGDDFSLGELPFEDVTLEYDEEQLINDARITREGGTEQTAEDAASIAAYLRHSVDRSGLLMDDDSAAAIYADTLVFVSKDPELRFVELVLFPQRNPDALYPQALGRQIGDRITVSLRPPGGGVITRDVFIRGITHDFTRTTWRTSWVLQSATLFAGFVLDDAQDGLLDGDAVLIY